MPLIGVMITCMSAEGGSTEYKTDTSAEDAIFGASRPLSDSELGAAHDSAEGYRATGTMSGGEVMQSDEDAGGSAAESFLERKNTSAGRHVRKTSEGWFLEKYIQKGSGRQTKKMMTLEPLQHEWPIYNNPDTPNNRRLNLGGWWQWNEVSEDFERIDAPVHQSTEEDVARRPRGVSDTRTHVDPPDPRTPADPPRPAADPPAPRPAPAPAPAPARGHDARRDDAAADARMERLAREMREQTAAIQRMTEESARRHAEAMRSIEEAQRRNEEARTARAAEAARITAEAAAVRNAGITERVILDTIDPHAREMAAALDAARPEGITGPELIAMKRAILERDSMILTDGIRRITSKAGIEVILKQRQQYDSLSTWSKWNLGQAFGIVGGTAVGGAGIAAMGITAAFGAWLWPGLAAGAAAGAAFRSIRHRIEIDRKTGRGTEWYHRNPNLAAALGATTFGAAGGAAAVVASWPSVAAFMKSLGGSAMGSIKSLLLRATSLSI